MTPWQTFKDHVSEYRLINNRLVFAGIFSAVLFSAVMLRLVILQVYEHEHFEALSDRNRISIEPLPPQRGLIFDRSGVILAENVPTFSLEVVPEKVVDMEATLALLTTLLSLTEEDINRFRERLLQHRRFDRVTLRLRLTEEEVARFAVHRHRLPGVDVVGRLVRHYPHGHLFAHSVGYVGRINDREMQLINRQNYRGTLHIGKTGIEKQYEDLLHGTVGYRHVETNVQGRIVRELQSVPAGAGHDLYLNMDINLQRTAAEALGEYNGAVVVMDPRNGGILALVSKPDFDPNLFISGISNQEYAELRDSIDRPLYDRALRGRYPPGSTLKPFVGLAGLEMGVVNERTRTFCPGWYSLPGHTHRFRCWRHQGHGTMNFSSAMAQSCDIYYYDLANNLGIDRLHQFLDLFRFGQKTGIDIPGENAGLSPSREWKRAFHNEAWYPGETLISGIGQGFNQMTPIQLAHATAILAMRGSGMTPQVLRASRVPADERLQLRAALPEEPVPVLSSRHWEATIESMIESVHGERGTARQISLDLPFEIAGKTGTAQVFSLGQDEKYDADSLDKRLHNHALFVAFAPADNPEIAIAIIVEHGGSGSSVAAPIARKLIDVHFGLQKEPEIEIDAIDE